MSPKFQFKTLGESISHVWNPTEFPEMPSIEEIASAYRITPKLIQDYCARYEMNLAEFLYPEFIYSRLPESDPLRMSLDDKTRKEIFLKITP